MFALVCMRGDGIAVVVFGGLLKGGPGHGRAATPVTVGSVGIFLYYVYVGVVE